MRKSEMNKLPSRVILWGGKGQARVMRPILEYYGAKVVAVFDDDPGVSGTFADVPNYTGWDAFKTWLTVDGGLDLGFYPSMGNPHGSIRISTHERLTAEGLRPVTCFHPSAIIEDSAEIGEGTQVLAGAYVGVDAVVGRYCVINTRSSIDHECSIGDGVDVSPGATVCGLVTVESEAWICAGSVILPHLKVGRKAIVGAGAVVTKDVASGTTVIGIPAGPKVR